MGLGRISEVSHIKSQMLTTLFFGEESTPGSLSCYIVVVAVFFETGSRYVCIYPIFPGTPYIVHVNLKPLLQLLGLQMCATTLGPLRFLEEFRSMCLYDWDPCFLAVSQEPHALVHRQQKVKPFLLIKGIWLPFLLPWKEACLLTKGTCVVG